MLEAPNSLSIHPIQPQTHSSVQHGERPLGVHFDEESRKFLLQGKGMTYSLGVDGDGEVWHQHWGRGIDRGVDDTFVPVNASRLDYCKREWPDTGRGDFRIPAFCVRTADGHTVSHLQYEKHTIETEL